MKNEHTSTKAPTERDRFHLYQIAVQSPEHDADFIDRVYRKKNGRLPRLLREDFCGTAFLAAHWTRVRRENHAVAVDLDRTVLEWGRAHNLKPLGVDAKRLQLVCADVRTVERPKADVIVAFNYSYFVFKERRDLLDYFRKVRRSLRKGGMFAVDLFGGSDTQGEGVDRTRQKGFVFIWQQGAYDPVTCRTQFFIDFEFDHAPPIRRAFSYDWRMWSIAEIRDVLADAGFRHADVYWESIDPATGEGSGEYRLVKTVRNHPTWNAIIVSY